MKYLIPTFNVFFIKGYYRALIVDPVRNKIDLIPNDIIDFINFTNGLDIYKYMENQKINKEIIDEYLDFLITNEYCFISENEPEFFEKQIVFSSPNNIDNSIIVFGHYLTKEIFNDFCEQLELLECRVLEIHIFKENFKKIEIISQIIEHSFQSISIIISCDKKNVEFCKSYLSDLFFRSKCKVSINIICPEIEDQEINSQNLIIKILNGKYLINKSCGKIKKNLFTTDLNVIREAHHHNTCLNRKISIDAEGNIRNCPSMPQSFGNIKDTTLQQALDHPDFKKYWNHKKDDIEVCRDCEFRYICTDCRAYLEDPHNEYSKPLKCGYDPYTGEWSEWSANPLKQAAIKYYGMEDMIND